MGKLDRARRNARHFQHRVRKSKVSHTSSKFMGSAYDMPPREPPDLHARRRVEEEKARKRAARRQLEDAVNAANEAAAAG